MKNERLTTLRILDLLRRIDFARGRVFEADGATSSAASGMLCDVGVALERELRARMAKRRRRR